MTIAAASGAFYFVLPQLAKAAGSWRAVLTADWKWLPVVIAASALPGHNPANPVHEN